MGEPILGTMKSGYWHALTTSDFEAFDNDRTVAVLPVAAIEQHGPHLPLATDAMINDGITGRFLHLHADSDPTVLVLPTQTTGYSLEHTSFPGTLHADAATLIELWTRIGRGVAAAGLKKLVILNSHGGQKSLVDIVAVRLRAELGMHVARANYFAFGVPSGLFGADEIANGIHGGEVETSLMLHIAPQHVRTKALRNFDSRVAELRRSNSLLGIEKPVGIGWMSEDVSPDGVCGNAANADAERGKVYLDHLAESLSVLVRELAAY